jgi:hypothetical protein
VAAQPERALALASASKLELLRRSIIRRAASRVNDLEPLLSYLGHLPSSAERVMALDETLRALEGHATVKLPRAGRASTRFCPKTPTAPLGTAPTPSA